MACKGGELCLASKCLNAISCHDLKVADPKLPDGVYTIDPDGAGGVAAFPIWCDMTTNGGGWSLVARMTTAGNQAHWDTGAVGLGGGHVKPDNPATQKYSDAIINLIKDKSAYIGPTPYRMRCWEGQTFVQTMWCSTQCTFHAQDSVNSGPCALCTSAFEGGLVQLGPNTGTRGLGHHHDGSQAWSMAYQRHPEEGNNSGCRNDSRGGGDGHLWVK
ncbi:MAG: hypothetical protein EXR79_14860 [Myxococcales bacterium]|nr:hypothetical protein [Myxococcales bacterium]